MKYKGIVFDLDHTLFDRYGTFRALGDEFYKSFKPYLSPELTKEEAVELWCKTDKDKVYLGWQQMLQYGEELGLYSPAPDIKLYSSITLPLFCTVAVPFPFTKPTLTKLREMGYQLGLITNGSSEIQRSKLKLLSLEEFFDEILIPSELGMQKPDPEPFLEMAKRLHCNPSELMYVGDNPINDVQASKNAGYTSVWVKTTGVWVEGIPKADFEMDTIEELPILLTKFHL